MEKKLYKAPEVKVKAINLENMICNSDPDSISGGVGGDPISGGNVDAKPNYFTSRNLWEDEDEED